MDGPNRTFYINEFLRITEDISATGDSLAATVMKAVAFPSEKARTAFQEAGGDPEFLKTVTAAFAATCLDHDIKGTFLAEVYRSPDYANGSLADCVAAVLAYQIGRRNGGLTDIQFFEKRFNMADLTHRLSSRYEDFALYLRVFKSQGETVDHIIDMEADGPVFPYSTPYPGGSRNDPS